MTFFRDITSAPRFPKIHRSRGDRAYDFTPLSSLARVVMMSDPGRATAGDPPRWVPEQEVSAATVSEATPSSSVGSVDCGGMSQQQQQQQHHLFSSGKSQSCYIVVNPRQRGNPILSHVRNVPYEFGDTVADYELGQTTAALFLSVQYHSLHPDYIHTRLTQLGRQYQLRIILLLIDVNEPHFVVKELTKICLMADCTLILAWSPEEAGRYLETYKAFENKPPDLIKERTNDDYMSRVTDCLTTVRSINKTDALTLINTFKTVEAVLTASVEDLTLCPGLGPQKAKRLHQLINEPFVKSTKQKERLAKKTQKKLDMVK